MEKVRHFVRVLRNTFEEFEVPNIIEDIEQSVENFGVKVYYSDMSSFKNPNEISGYSRVNDEGKPEIVVNGNEPEERRRFTMAHELGHIILHWKWLNRPGERLDLRLQEILYRKDDVYNPEENIKEQQANEFAAELLAPIEMVKEYTKGYNSLSAMQQSFIQLKVAKFFNISRGFAKVQIRKATKERGS